MSCLFDYFHFDLLMGSDVSSAPRSVNLRDRAQVRTGEGGTSSTRLEPAWGEIKFSQITIADNGLFCRMQCRKFLL